jgi:hypothetical protein
MRRPKDIGTLTKASGWLADALTTSIFVAAAHTATHRRIRDLELRLAIALEVYGETIRGGDAARVQVLLDELETDADADRRSPAPYQYEDPVYQRDGMRYVRRRTKTLRSRLDRMDAAGTPRRETRHLREEVEMMEKHFGENAD